MVKIRGHDYATLPTRKWTLLLAQQVNANHMYKTPNQEIITASFNSEMQVNSAMDILY